MRIAPFAAAALLAPSLAFAAGSDSTAAPATTKTTTTCEAGQVYDTKTKSCVEVKSDLIDDDTRYNAVRELAYAAQYDRALAVLAAMSNQQSSRVLTYYGFIARKRGQVADAMGYYTAALDADADNILARSYLGQGLVEMGQSAAASKQLAEIRARGGAGTWAEASLDRALTTGVTTDY